LIQEAVKQAKIIRDNAAASKKSLLDETDKQAEVLISEAKKRGFVAEMAAKEAAKQLRNEVANKSEDIIKEANKKLMVNTGSKKSIKNAKGESGNGSGKGIEKMTLMLRKSISETS